VTQTRNTARHYGSVARTLHWLTALLILTALPLGLYANRLPFDTDAAVAWKTAVFSLHKTLGVSTFLVAVIRILWALSQPRPLPLHPDRRVETFLANLVHWALYLSLVLVPLTGWVEHAASVGYAPILWPLGQDLPLVPKSVPLSVLASELHLIFTKVLIGSILLHIAGALKHGLIDRDGTLARMVTGRAAGPAAAAPQRAFAPALVALMIYAAGAAFALSRGPSEAATVVTPAPAAVADGNWQVEGGSLGFTVRQMGADVAGGFARWSATITFDPAVTSGKAGSVTVMIDTGSLSVGPVSEQAKGSEFLDVARYPQAVFSADILRDGTGYIADGTIDLRGVTFPARLPFSLTLAGDTATMTGRTTLDRRDFGIGHGYPDETSLGFDVTVDVAMTAQRKAD
jgi:cytochrome b561/polyisoprenoid-binding protein YceI